jgi:hypothetical protein
LDRPSSALTSAIVKNPVRTFSTGSIGMLGNEVSRELRRRPLGRVAEGMSAPAYPCRPEATPARTSATAAGSLCAMFTDEEVATIRREMAEG